MRAERKIATFLPLALLAAAFGAHAALRLAPLPDPGAGEAGAPLRVVSDADGGRGSLREALFDAMLAERPATIRLTAPTVTVRTPLPPLFHPRSLAIESAIGTTLEPAPGAGPTLLQIPGGDVELAGIGWRDAEVGLRAESGTILLRDVAVERCATGVDIGGDAALSLEASRLAGNARAVELGPGASARIERNTFAGNGTAVRAVAFQAAGTAEALDGAPATPAPDPRLRIAGNRFDGDRLSLVLGAIAAVVEDNDLDGARQAAVYLGGGGVRMARNRISDASRAGILVVDGDGLVIEDNELRRIAGAAIALSGGRANRVRANRLGDNGLGILAKFGAADHALIDDNRLADHRLDGIYVLAAAPRLRGNLIAGSRRSDLRIADLIHLDGRREVAAPRLERNRLGTDGAGAPVRALYRLRRGFGGSGG